MPVAILDPFSGIAGDMTLGALVACGLDREWLRALPETLGIPGVRVDVREVLRGEIACWKVDFDIPPQPEARGIREIRDLVAQCGAPPAVRERADAVFTAIAVQEAAIHGMSPDDVHLHEVGAVDAILDVVGSVWGFELLGVRDVFCGPIQLGDGFVRAAHGMLPVPAPATLNLLEGIPVRPGPASSGELVTPTGAALVKVLAAGRPTPAEYVPRASGFGAGTKDFVGRPNALRLILADLPARANAAAGGAAVEALVSLTADVDDMSPEYLAAAADELRAAGALDVAALAIHMKKGRLGTRLEVLARPEQEDALRDALFLRTTTIGVRTARVVRHALPREHATLSVDGSAVRVKLTRTPDGAIRAKPEADDVIAAARATGLTPERIVSRVRDMTGDA